MTHGIYRVVTKVVESFTVEANSEEHAMRIFDHGEFIGEADRVEEYEVVSAEFIKETPKEE